MRNTNNNNNLREEIWKEMEKIKRSTTYRTKLTIEETLFMFNIVRIDERNEMAMELYELLQNKYEGEKTAREIYDKGTYEGIIELSNEYLKDFYNRHEDRIESITEGILIDLEGDWYRGSY